MFDERFNSIEKLLRKFADDDLDDIKQFIFENIIPEVLKSVLNVETSKNDWNDYVSYWIIDIKWKTVLENIKQKAKENFWIDL